MSVCDVDEDVITLSAEAMLNVVRANNLQPNDIGRIYVGTESSIDGSKPIASYLLGILTQYYVQQGFDSNALINVDVVDMTFACIGAIDAMHNSLAYLMTEPDKKAIVIAADIANYDLASSGEYTQGAGAAAVLLSVNPKLMSINPQVGVAAACVHDFFKPLRIHPSVELGGNDHMIYDEDLITVHRETPVFDGPLSNYTYKCRIEEALHNYSKKSGLTMDLDHYDSFIFHLPYAYHGRRIIDSIFLMDLKSKGQLNGFYDSLPVSKPNKEEMPADEFKSAKRAWKKSIVKSPLYTEMVNNKIERSERLSSRTGNVYTASIFLALISDLYYSLANGIKRDKVLFFAYGSGSKSKVFGGDLVAGWEEIVESWQIDKQLADRKKINFDTYVEIRLHRLHSPVLAKSSGVSQCASGITDTNRFSRTYVLQ
jgi:hydroxymethylglutaryl-CoA synthase